jgi:hypothetical protein
MNPLAVSLVVSASVIGVAGCWLGDPINGRYTLQSAKVSVDGTDHVVIDARAANDGSDVWDGERCVTVYWEATPGVSRDQARTGVQDSTVKILETQQRCANSSHSLDAGDGDSFSIVSTHTRAELAGSLVVTVTETGRSTIWDDRINLPTP